MSFARWGCEGSDVYVFESGRGFEIWYDHKDGDGDMIEVICPNAKSCAEALKVLRNDGYSVPQSTIDNLTAVAASERESAEGTEAGP